MIFFFTYFSLKFKLTKSLLQPCNIVTLFIQCEKETGGLFLEFIFINYLISCHHWKENSGSFVFQLFGDTFGTQMFPCVKLWHFQTGMCWVFSWLGTVPGRIQVLKTSFPTHSECLYLSFRSLCFQYWNKISNNAKGKCVQGSPTIVLYK